MFHRILNFKSGFHRIQMDKKSIQKIAFNTEKEHSVFTKMHSYILTNNELCFDRVNK